MIFDINQLKDTTSVALLVEEYWKRGYTNPLSITDGHTMILDLSNHKDKVFKDLKAQTQQFVKTWLSDRQAIDYDAAMKMYDYL